MAIRPKTLLVIVSAVVVLAIGGTWAFTSWRFAHPAVTVQEHVDRGIDPDNMAKFQERIAQQEAAVKDGPRDIAELLVLGNLYYEVGDLAKAAAAYRDILSTNRNDAPAHENLGQTLMEMGDYAGAEQHLRAALATSPYEPTYIKLADLIDQHFPERSREVQSVLETAIANLGQTPGLLVRLGQWYEKQGNLDEAVSHYEVAHQLAPEDDSITQELEQLRSEAKKAQ